MEDSIYVFQLLFSNCSKLYEAGLFAVKQFLVAEIAAGIYLDLGVKLFGFKCRSLQSLGVLDWLVIAGLVFGFGDSIASFRSSTWSPNRDAKAVVLKTCLGCCSLELAVQQMVSFGLTVLGLYLS
ncbi:hypothetical protein Nepgr_006727 [Nepenthes gracilis]|uniref:Uncharacterized protein n=1 Tax=Nepenthes gracilis TaxID=150966 RepID=A0AAD3XHL2_NEPGR|nr:hypothetical protein Nepgr_006727 [Nepenthes gracilis]